MDWRAEALTPYLSLYEYTTGNEAHMVVTVFSLLYLLLTHDKAMLRIRGHNAPHLAVTILHEKLEGVIMGTHLAGYGEFSCDVQHGEIIVITVRTNNAVVATAILQIDIGLAGQCGD